MVDTAQRQANVVIGPGAQNTRGTKPEAPVRQSRINWWGIAVVFTVVACSGFYVGCSLAAARATGGAGAPDWVAWQAQRLATVQKRLAEIRPTEPVGYLCDSGGTSRTTMTGPEINDYYLSQHVLAPLVLDLNARRREWVVVNLRSEYKGDAVLAGFAVAGNFGDGVLLLRRTGR